MAAAFRPRVALSASAAWLGQSSLTTAGGGSGAGRFRPGTSAATKAVNTNEHRTQRPTTFQRWPFGTVTVSDRSPRYAAARLGGFVVSAGLTPLQMNGCGGASGLAADVP